MTFGKALLCATLLVTVQGYFIIFTAYVPDVYVFVRWAIADNLTRDISVSSLISNNFIFDVLVVLGDELNISTAIEWVLLISLATITVNFVKYYYLFRYYRGFGVLILALASFFLDINQLRFGLSITLLFLSFIAVSKFNIVSLLFLSFFSHVTPLIFYLLSKFAGSVNYGLFFFGLMIPLFVLMNATFLGEFSRIFEYLKDADFYFPKILFVSLPSIYYLYSMRAQGRSLTLVRPAWRMASFLVVFSIPFSFVNINISARFIEVSYIIVCFLNAGNIKSKKFDIVLLVISIAILLSRLYSGIHGQADFVDEYILR